MGYSHWKSPRQSGRGVGGAVSLSYAILKRQPFLTDQAVSPSDFWILFGPQKYEDFLAW